MKYNNQWVLNQFEAGDTLKYIFFWGHRPSKDGSITKTCFSQWWESSFEIEGIVYRTAEHWMMAEKARLFKDEHALQLVLTSQTPAAAKQAGRTVQNFRPELWDQQKFATVVKGNYHKFSQNDSLRTFLIDTKERILVEASPVDPVWGIGIAADHPNIENPAFWKGENLLGYALMEVRDQLS